MSETAPLCVSTAGTYPPMYVVKHGIALLPTSTSFSFVFYELRQNTVLMMLI